MTEHTDIGEHTNMINQGPRSDDSCPINRFRTHNERQVVENFMKKLKEEFPVKDSADVEKLILGLKSHISSVNAHLGAIYNTHKAGGLILDRATFKDEAQRRYLDLLSKYSKDELHLLMTCILSDLSVKEWV